MDVNSSAETSTKEINSSVELESVVELPHRGFVPKIRIRLRPQLIKSPNLESQNLLCNKGSLKDICDTVDLVQPISDIFNWNSEKRCYKTLEDSGGGGVTEPNKYKNQFMIHGINLRSRPQKLINQNHFTKSDKSDKKKFNLLPKSQNQEFNTTSKLKPISRKPVYQHITLSKSNSIDEMEKRNIKLSRKQVNKNRNETIISNINLKEIINQQNFMKFPPEIQWQLVNLLPNCDKPKLSADTEGCKCMDYICNSNEDNQILPNLGFSVLNNEFLGKALTKFSLKMGQCDLINILNSERENLRSRPLTLLNDDVMVKSIVENEIELNIDQNSFIPDSDNNKIQDEIKSNSSTTTETVEMNEIGVTEEKRNLEFNDCINSDTRENETLSILKTELSEQNNVENDEDDGNNQLEYTIMERSLLKTEKINFENTNCFTNLNQNFLINVDDKKPSFPKLAVELNTKAEFNDENRRKRGRKRKMFTSNDLQIIPIKRSNRSTAGKRPARLDSESPPTSPNIFTINEKKINIRCKKFKDQINFNKKHKLKYENNGEELDNIIKLEIQTSKKIDNSNDHLKIFPSSPDSLLSTQTESDSSPLSKPSPNGCSLYNNFTRSNLPSNHINSVQTLSPSWSCTSESTTPSAKSDYGHNQSTKLNFNTQMSVSDISMSETSMDSEVKQVQRMPPPRQTLTLAAMREKMRAKKLAKEDNRKISNSSNRKSSTFLNNQRHKKQCLNTLLKEGEDDFKLMEKMISNADDLLNNSQESLLEFFMGNNYEFDATSEQCFNLNSVNYKSNLPKKISLKSIVSIKEKGNKIINHCDNNNFDEINIQSNRINFNSSKFHDKIINPYLENPLLSNQSNKEAPTAEKSFNDAISYVLQKLNLSKDNNGVLSHNTPGKTSIPNAYLVDSNGLTTALSIIQSLNPGAKVTTQQFYLVNSGPQLILQPNPPLPVVSDKIAVSSSQLGFPTKVSLAPKLTNPISVINQMPNVMREHLSTNNNLYNGVALNNISYNQTISDKSSIQTSESIIDCRSSTSLKLSATDTKSAFLVSSITPTISNQSRNLHLQTISTPQPIGFVQPVQQALPSLFPSQLRFMQPLSNSATTNTISFLTSANANCNNSIVNTNQSPKLLFLCPTAPNNTNLVTASNVLNQDQKYLLLSKQPDKQATIQLVSSQGLWQQLNPNIISQPNNVLVMQSQPINTLYESLICPQNTLPTVSAITPDQLISERKNQCLSENQQLANALYKEQNKPTVISNEYNSSSLIMDSRSHNSNNKNELYLESKMVSSRLTNIDSSMTNQLSNHACQSVNTYSFVPTIQSVTQVVNENNNSIDKNYSGLLPDNCNGSILKSDQLDMLQSSNDVNLS